MTLAQFTALYYSHTLLPPVSAMALMRLSGNTNNILCARDELCRRTIIKIAKVSFSLDDNPENLQRGPRVAFLNAYARVVKEEYSYLQPTNS